MAQNADITTSTTGHEHHSEDVVSFSEEDENQIQNSQEEPKKWITVPTNKKDFKPHSKPGRGKSFLGKKSILQLILHPHQKKIPKKEIFLRIWNR